MRGILHAALGAALLSATVAVAQPPTEVEGIEAVSKMVPMPKVGEGAPYYSPQQLEAEIAEANRNANCITAVPVSGARMIKLKQDLLFQETHVRSKAEAAHRATLAAEEARRRAAQGLTGTAEVEGTELARQKAVRDYDLRVNRAGMLGYDPRIDPDPPVAVEQLAAELGSHKGKPALFVSGTIRNIWPRAAKIPVVTVILFDVSGNPIYATAARPDSVRLKVGESRPFAIRVPSFHDAASVEVAPGEHAAFGGRDFCDGLKENALGQALEYWYSARERLLNPPPGAAPQLTLRAPSRSARTSPSRD